MKRPKDSYGDTAQHDQDLGESLADHYPPGPADDPEVYKARLLLAEAGLLVPTDEIRDGNRIWRQAPHRYSWLDFPPGPRDEIHAYGLMFEAADDGWLRPTNQIRDGGRLWVGVPARKLN